MKKIDEIVEIIKNEELEDILNIGWIDRDEEIVKFVPTLNTIFFEFKSKYLTIHREQNTDFEICIELINKDEILNEKYCNEIFKEYEFCTSSLLNMFLYKDRKQNFVTKMEAYSENEEKYNNGIVKCIGFEIRDNSYVFLDPLSFNSIEVGKKEERDQWFESILNDKQCKLLSYNPEEMFFKEWRKEDICDQK